MKIDAVMFATDFSAASDPAARMARELAAQLGAQLHLVHVVPPITDPYDADPRLKRLAAECAPELRATTSLLSGRPARQIVRYAREHRIGIIVLGTHGRTGVSHALLGSVAEGVVRLAGCPVLTVPAAAPAAGPLEPETEPAHRCLVCHAQTDDLICETCRAHIRAEALERKLEAERPGRRTS